MRKFFWVKGHDDNEFNELADMYANNSAKILNPKIEYKLSSFKTISILFIIAFIEYIFRFL